MSEIERAVRERYAAKANEIAERTKGGGCGCGPDCCAASYSAEDLATIGLDATASLGCGDPTLLADLHPGETALDLGSGPGIDVLRSARPASPRGHAYAGDM